MENLSPQMGKIRIYILTRTSVRSSEFQGWEEESRPIESEMTPSPVGGRGVQAEDLPVGGLRQLPWRGFRSGGGSRLITR